MHRRSCSAWEGRPVGCRATGEDHRRHFRPSLEQADRYGGLGQTIGYIVANAFETWNINGATGETIHTELIDDWTAGGYMPAAFCYDHEIHECYTSTGAKITATAHNLKTSLAENTLNTWKKFKRVVSVYSAKWFMNLRADYWLEHDTYFHNINLPEAEGGAGVQRPLMMAWYAQNMSKQYSNVSGVQADLLKPSPDGWLVFDLGHQAIPGISPTARGWDRYRALTATAASTTPIRFITTLVLSNLARHPTQARTPTRTRSPVRLNRG